MTIENKPEYTNDSRITRLEVTNENINSTLIRIEKRLDSLENKMDLGFKEVNNRLWLNFYWTIGGFAGLLAVIAKGFHWY